MNTNTASPKEPQGNAQAIALGRGLRSRRKHLRVSAIAAAEAAGISRVTLHRIERGEPSVSMGATLAVTAALGLALDLVDPEAATRNEALRQVEAALPERIDLAEYPQLQSLAWQLNRAGSLTPGEALNLYERQWRHVQKDAMTPRERALLNSLVRTLGAGRLLA